MPDLESLQREFKNWLLAHPPQPEEEAAIRLGLSAGGAAQTRAGLAIYRNNVFHSLTKALREIFPVIDELSGAEFFNTLAHEYICACPPAEPRLREFGRALPEFIAKFPPLARHPYFADVARLELLWLDAYHASEAAPLAPEALSAATAQAGALVLSLHPSLGLLASAYPVGEIWGRVKAQAPLADLKMDAPARLAIARPGAEVEITPLSAGAYAMLEAMSGGAALETACAAALAQDPDFEPGAALGGALGHGFVVAVDFAAGA